MSDTSIQDFYTQQAAEARGPESPRPSRRKRRRKRVIRIAIAAASSLVAVVGLVAGGGFLYLNHEIGSVQRIHVAALDAKDQPLAPPESMTILLTASGMFPGADVPTGLIELIHFNADHQGGAVISFPANLLVHVPGHGEQRLGETLALGGASLMIETLEHLTDVRINHYSQVTYSGLQQIVGAIGGVDVDVPFPTTSFGVHFPAGINHITSATALPYVRQPSVSQVTRTDLQENLFRAILHKICSRGLFNPGNFGVLEAVVRAVTVDSNLSNSQLVRLAHSLARHMQGSGESFVVPTAGNPDAGFTTPVYLETHIAKRLWRAIRDGRLAQFAQRYPFTVTPGAPG
jgi:LCP family protein required for cell wall assembly